MDLRTDEFDYVLPAERIAQHPSEYRDQSKLMILNRQTRAIEHDRFDRIVRFLRKGDLLVANRSRVIPARIQAQKQTGGAIELLLTQRLGGNRWITMANPSRRLRRGATLVIPGTALNATLEERVNDGQWKVLFDGSHAVEEDLERVGSIPLPPYIKDADSPIERYQTVYADCDGSIAAPTAGLHFSPDLLQRVRDSGIGIELLTLHVGAGTFRPVSSHHVAEHRMLPEWGEITPETAEAINAVRALGGRVVAVGTTTTRLLESSAQDGKVVPFRGETDRFIYPGYVFRVIDGLITNFHLPRSTLLMLVSAFAGREMILSAYQTAIAEGYRFYSFGDAMLIH